MTLRRRLSSDESRAAALAAARLILIEEGAQAVTLKSVAARMGRTHANLLHHFGSAAELQKALAAYMADNICAAIGSAVIASRLGVGTARAVVDLAFDAFEHEGGGQLASWLRITGNEEALAPIVDAVHQMVEELHPFGSEATRHVTLTLVLLALGDALMGAPLAAALAMPRATARDMAERLLISETARLGLSPPPRPVRATSVPDPA
ncbi:MAG TPA: TetR family transcriptional regulator [Novosphingobium sp.]|nr:TetR family transcriptional regulator [Novosphingobium sp.]